MISIPVLLSGATLQPSKPLPPDAVRIVCDGAYYHCYSPGDDLPPEPPADPAAVILTELISAVQGHLDATARTHNYDGILSACTYATSTVDRFRAEGQACVEWRDVVWSSCYGVMAAVQSGQRPIPTPDDLIAELPPMVWP